MRRHPDSAYASSIPTVLTHRPKLPADVPVPPTDVPALLAEGIQSLYSVFVRLSHA